MYKNIPKTPKTVLIDHNWLPYVGTDRDWTSRIEDWLEEEDFTVYRLVRETIEPRLSQEMATFRKWEIPIKYAAFSNYLAQTDKIENFVITHHESYSYGVIDMVARGIRTVTPPDFLSRNSIVEVLELPIFEDKRSLLRILNEPINNEAWKAKILKMTDYCDIARLMDIKIQELLRE
jgi:hypothetical protein